MGYIEFDKNRIINLEYSLDKELVRSNRSGSFSCTTIIGCNTRKYHGLLICPQPKLDHQNHVLLSKLDETVIQQDAEFNLGINKYPFAYNPKGHKYIEDFSADVIPVITFRVGGVILTKEIMFATEEERVLIRYTLVQAKSATKLKLSPFLAYRPVHELSKRNLFINTKYKPIPKGIQINPYDGYSNLHIQISADNPEYVHAPDWFEKIEYNKEQERGYDFQEDLFVPGFFEFDIKKGESVIFTAGTKRANPDTLSKIFDDELQQRTPRNSFENCLINSAEQFVYKKSRVTEIVAGYPWYDRIGRYTFMSLPGLTLSTNNPDTCLEVINSMTKQMKGPFFPESGKGDNVLYGSADTSLWFIRALQEYAEHTATKDNIWKKYGRTISIILNGLANAEQLNIKLEKNGLLSCNNEDIALTWMNAIVNNKPVIGRAGFIVEINALWYNAIMFALELATIAKDDKFLRKWNPIAKKIPDAFLKTFWDENTQSMYDFVTQTLKDDSVRPNQVIITSLPFSPVEEIIRMQILEKCKNELLTPRGLRTLSPKNMKYQSIYNGSIEKRETASFQGIVWPWLLEHFAEGYLKIYKQEGLKLISDLYNGFEETMKEAGIGTISEMYESDPPHKSCGAISFASSVAAILKIKSLIEKYNSLNLKKNPEEL